MEECRCSSARQNIPSSKDLQISLFSSETHYFRLSCSLVLTSICTWRVEFKAAESVLWVLLNFYILEDTTNAALKLNHFPQTLNNADIVMICKPNKNQKQPKLQIHNLRVINKHRNWKSNLEPGDIIEHLNVIPDNQFDFRKSHSIILKLCRVVETKGFSNKGGWVLKWNKTSYVWGIDENFFIWKTHHAIIYYIEYNIVQMSAAAS